MTLVVVQGTAGSYSKQLPLTFHCLSVYSVDWSAIGALLSRKFSYHLWQKAFLPCGDFGAFSEHDLSAVVVGHCGKYCNEETVMLSEISMEFNHRPWL